MSEVPISSHRRTYLSATAVLTPKEKIYVEARAAGSMPVAAARIAGYAEPDAKADELEKDPNMRVAIETGARLAMHKQEITRATVTEILLDALPLVTTATEQVAVGRELGKLHGVYAPSQHETKIDVNVRQEQLQRVSDEELMKMAGRTIDLVEFEEVEEPAALSNDDEVHQGT